MTDAELGFWQTLGGAYLGARIPSGPAHAVGVLTLASAESHDDPSFVLGTPGRVARHARCLPGARPRHGRRR
jgi:hypothetical protein